MQDRGLRDRLPMRITTGKNHYINPLSSEGLIVVYTKNMVMEVTLHYGLMTLINHMKKQANEVRYPNIKPN